MTQVNIEVLHLAYVIIIKELAEKQFTCLGENTEKYLKILNNLLIV